MDHDEDKPAANAEKDVTRSANAETGVTPNIKFTGRPAYDRTGRHKLTEPAPVERIQFNGQTIELPAADVQKRKRLFYHEDAALIVRLLPNLYKKVKGRGNK